MSGKVCVERNPRIDILKYICSLLVICIHIQFAGKQWLEPLTRAAVPVFFVISGWFYSDDRAVQKKQILKIAWIFVLSCALYLLVGLVKANMSRIPPAEFLKSLFSLSAAKLFVLYNHVGIEVHLWYLPALLYALVIAALLGEKGRRKVVFLVPLLVAGSLALGLYSPLLLGRKLPNFVGRNFLFTAIPCFLLGEHLRRVRHRLRIGPAVLLCVLVLSAGLCLCERAFVQGLTGYEGGDLYIGSVFMAVSMLLLATSPFGHSPGLPGRILAAWGRKYSLGVYVLHMAVVWLVQLVFDPVFRQSHAAAEIYRYTAPLIILLATTALTALLKAVQKPFAYRKTK